MGWVSKGPSLEAKAATAIEPEEIAMRTQRRVLKNRAGAVLPLVAAGMGGLIGFIAISVDIGMLFSARAETRRATDAAVLAAVSAFYDASGSGAITLATERALEYAQMNMVRGASVTADQVTVDADTIEKIMAITVSVRVPTIFARIFGTDSVTVSSTAKASLMATSTVECLKPFALPDAWDDDDGDGYYDSSEYYDPAVTGYGSVYRNDDGTGYINDMGREITLQGGAQDKSVTGGYFLLDLNNDGSVNTNIRNMINDTTCAYSKWNFGDGVPAVEPGNKVGQVRQGIDSLIVLDPDLVWDTDQNTYTGSSRTTWQSSPRVVTAMVYDPRYPLSSTNSSLVIKGFAGLYLIGTANVKGTAVIYARLASVRGAPQSCDSTCANLATVVRIIQ
jgi:hypothetical protein